MPKASIFSIEPDGSLKCVKRGYFKPDSDQFEGDEEGVVLAYLVYQINNNWGLATARRLGPGGTPGGGMGHKELAYACCDPSIVDEVCNKKDTQGSLSPGLLASPPSPASPSSPGSPGIALARTELPRIIEGKWEGKSSHIDPESREMRAEGRVAMGGELYVRKDGRISFNIGSDYFPTPKDPNTACKEVYNAPAIQNLFKHFAKIDQDYTVTNAGEFKIPIIEEMDARHPGMNNTKSESSIAAVIQAFHSFPFHI